MCLAKCGYMQLWVACGLPHSTTGSCEKRNGWLLAIGWLLAKQLLYLTTP
jgi:hypothetical protein